VSPPAEPGDYLNDLRRVLPRVIAGAIKITVQMTNQLFDEITKNVQKFIAGRSQKRPKRPKTHKSFAYKIAT
jgi:hypothetical protein